jgi:hypothetical protein
MEFRESALMSYKSLSTTNVVKLLSGFDYTIVYYTGLYRIATDGTGSFRDAHVGIPVRPFG